MGHLKKRDTVNKLKVATKFNLSVVLQKMYSANIYSVACKDNLVKLEDRLMDRPSFLSLNSQR